MWTRSFIDVSIVTASVQLAKDGKVIRVGRPATGLKHRPSA
jgi:hypothetical protein